MKKTRVPQGYIAIVSALMLSAILTVIVFTVSTNMFWSRYEQLNQNMLLEQRVVASSCLYQALLEYSENPDSLQDEEVIEETTDTKTRVCNLIAKKEEDGSMLLTADVSGKGITALLSVRVLSEDSTGRMLVTSWRNITSIPP